MADKDVFEAYKLAYQAAATRYDNIYRSAWTIFSYMTVASAGILSFGGQRFYGEPLTVLAILPLIFWFWTTFLPLNRYGDQTLENLVVLEERISKETGATIDHFSSFMTRRRGGVRARHAIYFFLAVLHVAFLWAFCASANKVRIGHQLVKEPPAATSSQGRP